MAEVEKLYVNVGAKTDDLKSGMNEAKQIIGGVAASLGFAFGGREIARAVAEVTELSGVSEGVAEAFERIATPGLLNDLVKATKGTVSQLELMQQAVRADNFKIPLDVLTRGLEFATRRAKETGEQVDFLVNSFVTGIGRKSALVMDNLGISATELQAEVKRVGDFATAVGNIMEREMSGMGEAIDTVKDKTDRLNAQWDDTKVLLGDIASEGLNMKDGLDKASEAMTDLNTVLADETVKSDMSDFLQFLIATYPLAAGASLAVNKFKDDIADLADEIRDNMDEAFKSPSLSQGPFAADWQMPVVPFASEEELEALDKKELDKLKKETDDLDKVVRKTIMTWDDYEEQQAAIIERNQELTWSQDMIVKQLPEIEQGYDDVAAVANALTDVFLQMGDSITSSLADAFTGDSGVEGFFQNLIKIIADAAAQLGKVLMSIGTAMMLIPGLQGPAGAYIAGGLGLMLAGKVASNIIASRAESGGGAMQGAGALTPAVQKVALEPVKIDNRYIHLGNSRGGSFSNAVT